MKYFLLFTLSFFLLSCAALGTPGAISLKASDFDGSKVLTCNPAFADYECQFSLYYKTTMDSDKIYLTAYLRGAHNITDDKSLILKIDQNFYTFTPIDRLTDINYDGMDNWSSREYLIDLDFLNKMNLAKKIMYRILTLHGYIEGTVEEGPMGARKTFANFSKSMKKLLDAK